MQVLYSRSRSIQQPIFLRAIFPSTRAGEILEKAKNHIHQTYDISLQVYAVEDAKWGRFACTSGEPNKLAKAWYECAIRLSEGYFNFYEQARFGINFVLPSHFVDLLLFDGDLIRIAHRSGTKILVKHKCLMRSAERVVQINAGIVGDASFKCFEEAVYLLAIMIQDKLGLALSAGDAFYQERATDNIVRYLNQLNERNVVFDYTSQREIDKEEPIIHPV
ncbi:hypothetical protein INT47_012809 [Mucor saturninus]|uniref:Uncharacterized protein n=1 Tax=Mucor saturninus TaxID=64648 RepID=A0A8H7QRL8_9FUNG|nr:hypothetical protein INT47_012809 [Mucor saturninus]